MTRLGGRAARGERLLAKVPHGHWKTGGGHADGRSWRIGHSLLNDGGWRGERLGF